MDANGETENITRKKRERIQTIAAAPCRPTQLRGKRGASSSSSSSGLVLEGHTKKRGGGGRIDENRREKCGLVKSKVFSKKRYTAPVEGRGEKVH